MCLKRPIVVFFILFFLSIQQSLSQSHSYSDQECLSCHGKPDIAQIMIDGKVRSLFVDPEEWSQDIHHKGQLLCVDCHTLANPYLHFREGFIDVDCARCHPEEEEEYQKNIHLAFEFPSPGKELPLCFHCHTKHHVLRHDDPSSSVHEDNIGETCGSCHAEVMVQGVLAGSSLGKISGHRKGDISEKFDMNVCINCHYEDSAHGAKRVYKDFCSRCHDVRSTANVLMGPTHTALPRFSWLNYANSGLVLTFVLGIFILLLHRSRKSIASGVKSWLGNMKIEEEIQKEAGADEKEKDVPEPESSSEQAQEEIKKEEPEQKQERIERQEPVKEKAEEEMAREESPEGEKEDDAPAREEKPKPGEIDENGENQIPQKEEEPPDTEEPPQEETNKKEDNGKGEPKKTQ